MSRVNFVFLNFKNEVTPGVMRIHLKMPKPEKRGACMEDLKKPEFLARKKTKTKKTSVLCFFALIHSKADCISLGSLAPSVFKVRCSRSFNECVVESAVLYAPICRSSSIRIRGSK